MFDSHVEGVYVWLGVAAVSAAALGIVTTVPTTVPPDATVVADEIDWVAAGPVGGYRVHEIDATAIRLGPQQVALRNGAGTATASIAYGPVTPVGDDERLERLLSGTSPAAAFASQSAFETTVERAQKPTPWRPAPATVRVRRLDWGDVNVTLVG